MGEEHDLYESLGSPVEIIRHRLVNGSGHRTMVNNGRGEDDGVLAWV